MSVNQMSTGQDYAIFFYDGNTGNLVPLGDVQNVHAHALSHLLKTSPYNNPSRYGYIYDGYKLDFTVTRSGADLENFFVQAEANFNNGALQQPGVLQETVTNSDGSVSRYHYTNFVMFMPDRGEISKDKPVTMVLEGHASAKVQVT